jgi:hypothetical protein
MAYACSNTPTSLQNRAVYPHAFAVDVGFAFGELSERVPAHRQQSQKC